MLSELLDHFELNCFNSSDLLTSRLFSTEERLVSQQRKGKYKESEDEDTKHIAWNETARKNLQRR